LCQPADLPDGLQSQHLLLLLLLLRIHVNTWQGQPHNCKLAAQSLRPLLLLLLTHTTAELCCCHCCC
jgi:hypothetical protein